MQPYDESQVVQFAQDCVAVTSDVGRVGVQCARMQFDAMTMGYAVARSKHIAELKAEVNPNSVPVPSAQGLAPIGVSGLNFMINGQPWPFIGYTIQTLMASIAKGEDYGAILDEAVGYGFNSIIAFGCLLGQWYHDNGFEVDPR